MENREYGSHGNQVFEIEHHQNALLQELCKRDNLLGDIYLGALRVLADAENPTRFNLVGHNFREILDKLPKLLGIAISKVSMKSKVIELRDVWENYLAQSVVPDRSNKWGDTIELPLLRYLEKSETFFTWIDENRSKRKVEVERAIDEFEHSSLGMPNPIKALRIKEWLLYYDYFVKAAHHGTVEPDEFRANQFSFEQYLLDRLSPRTFKDIKEIDELIKQGELND